MVLYHVHGYYIRIGHIGFHIVGARENKHVPPALQCGIDYINPGEEDQMVSLKCASKSSESQKCLCLTINWTSTFLL